MSADPAVPTEAALVGAEVFWLKLPLETPYETATGRVAAFDAMVVRLEDEAGHVGWGEGCPVAGYSPETPEGFWERAQSLFADLEGRTPSEAAAGLQADFAAFAFLVSTLTEALEDLEGLPALRSQEPQSLELLAIVNSLDERAAAEMALELAGRGYRTLKAKIGYEVESDIRRIRALAEALAGRAILRVDANQGYDRDSATRFARGVPADALEVFEQPLPAHDWEGLAAVAAASPLPLMLDESIYDDDDIRRAGRLPGVGAVKLKLSKAGGAKGLLRQMRLASEAGLKLVVGNGIASDLGCLHEALVCRAGGLATAGEMNGFLKTPLRLTREPPVMQGPLMVLPPLAATAVERDSLEAAIHRHFAPPRRHHRRTT